MDLSKYRKVFFKKIKEQFVQWFEDGEETSIPNTEVYRFIHSIKGTSGTLQLGGILQVSGVLLEQMKDRNKEEWERRELREFLSELMELTFSYDHYEEIEVGKKHFRRENIPLIQIIDDDISLLIILKDFLEKQGWMVITNSNSDKAISQYFDLHPDCVVLDVNLPNKNGFEILRDLQSHSNKVFVPIIMMSILYDRDTRINAFKMGADDFIAKPIDLEELAVHIERHLQRKKIYDQSVLLDELTNVYNRKYLKVVFDVSMDELNRFSQPFSLAILDIDYFKKVNDRYGHLTGDKVLSQFASFLEENTRSFDTVFRYGGEEFIILFQNTEQQKANEIVTRLLERFSKQRFEIDGEDTYVSFSAGIHTISTLDTTIESAISAADKALYKAKELGRARVECFHEPSTELEKKKLYISIIDDDPIIRSMLAKSLQELEISQYEINIQVFENGHVFFDSSHLEIEGEHFLILDGVMPIMDGLDILQKVRETEKHEKVLVIMLTGRNSQEDIAKALKLGADDYMTKPFEIADLQARIMQLIHRKKIR
ncbi:diguanylate cyclase [Bacillus sp. FJAT-49736]|uniref:GGDEF domain-containing response regulator n=1 Tax=Bacillus sp. FJAT-49736 TaxID=2833582 RepID=UPI001BC8E791|nr:diguanylate cyclase [Bacillus sp. FJAT-49736]MBS4174287.1 diguanylate cyclase [Bacillus sp. FJAT-49736]